MTLAQLRTAAAAQPRHPGLQYNLGLALQEAGDLPGAAGAYGQATRLKPDFHQAWNNLGLVLEDLGQHEAAADAWRHALAVLPRYPAALRNLARHARSTGDLATARQCLLTLGELEPDNWDAHLGAALLLPAVHDTEADLEASRSRYSSDLDRLLARAATQPGALDRRLAAVERHGNFFLAYQGRDDLDLQVRYARLIRALIGNGLPELAAGGRRPAGGRRRIGFASSFLRDCTVGHYFRSWITELDRRVFDVRVYLLGGPEDFLTREIGATADRVLSLRGSLPEAAAAILADAPDILIYPELGMNPRAYALAALRLAPVQCAGWGHPVTTGHVTMDYFLSSAAMEPDDGDGHYRETLVRLPGLGTRYPRPRVGQQKGRGDFSLPEAGALYLFPHPPYKVHPEDDETLADLLHQDPAGTAVLCAGIDGLASRALRRRLEAALVRRGVPPQRLAWMPYLPRADFLELCRVCDVMLDAARWSGGQTSLDALAAGLPVVTRWGSLMRSRQSAGMLAIMGLDDLIVSDTAHGVALAVRLAGSEDERLALRQRLEAGLPRLFDDTAAIGALQEFLLTAGQ